MDGKSIGVLIVVWIEKLGEKGLCLFSGELLVGAGVRKGYLIK